MDALTVLGGTLVRVAHDRWKWRDGTPEPRARDLPEAGWHFRMCVRGGRGFAEVLSDVAEETSLLAWVLDGWRAGRYYSADHAGAVCIVADGTGWRRRTRPDEAALRVLQRAILVPAETWDRWCTDHPAGAAWNTEDEQIILARARELGWVGEEAKT